MKTKYIFLGTSIVMLLIEVILGIVIFRLENSWFMEMILILMMSIGLLITVLMFQMYRDAKAFDKFYEKL